MGGRWWWEGVAKEGRGGEIFFNFFSVFGKVYLRCIWCLFRIYYYSIICEKLYIWIRTPNPNRPIASINRSLSKSLYKDE